MYQNRNRELDIIALYNGDYKRQFYLREISKLAKIPLKTTQNLLISLENNNLLKSTIKGKNKYFKLNFENIQTKFFLLQSEIYKTILFLEKYPQLKTFLKSVITNAPIIVFGSFAKLTANKNSDLDLLVISEKEPKLSLHLIPNVHCINLKEDSFVKAIEGRETLIKEIEGNHIILNNHSFYVNLMWRYYGK